MSGALRGIKILDLSRVLAGPYCTMILGDLGAEVIKIERPELGDDTRHWGPPFQEDVSAYYMSINRNKKSVTANLKSETDIEMIKQLISECDVIINNFKTGTMERFGLGYDEVAQINSKIVYCSITGFGQTGPYKEMPGYDFIIQAMSGLMSITGTKKSGPQKSGIAIVDILTGLYATIGIQAALLERTISGKGQKIDVSLYDTAVSSLVNIGQNYLISKEIPYLPGNRNPNIVPYEAFDTRDGQVVIAVGNDSQFKSFCKLLRLDKLINDERFKTNPQRIQNRDILIPIIQKVLVKETTNYWQRLCDENNVPCGPIQTLNEVVKDPQLNAREMFIDVEHPTAGTLKLVGSPLKLSRTPVTYDQHPPNIGEHNDEILQSYRIKSEDE